MSAWTAPKTVSELVIGWIQSNITRVRSLQYQFTPKVGDWVLMNIGDTRRLSIGENPCRFIEDVAIQGILEEPDAVY